MLDDRPIPINAFWLSRGVITPTTLLRKVKFIISTVHKLYIALSTVDTGELICNKRINREIRLNPVLRFDLLDLMTHDSK